MFAPDSLFDLTQTRHAALLEGCANAWEALLRLADYLADQLEPGVQGDISPQAIIGDQVQIGKGTVVEPGAMITGPAIIGAGCLIRHNAYLRENVIVGDSSLVGNACELKHCLLFCHCEVPHFNYVGDSILGHRAHLGAGVVLSNVKITAGNVRVNDTDTGLEKFGALIGDRAEIGCNSVLNPGSIIGRDSLLYPNTNWRGVLAAGNIVKSRLGMDVVERSKAQ